jgi:predicted nucleic acid-binding protein
MSADRSFFDTNILVYAFSRTDSRNEIARALLLKGGVLGVQTLNEFVAVAVYKMGMPWTDVLEALNTVRGLCPTVVPVTIATHERALEVVARHKYHIYDSLMIAAALESRCSIFFSEDMHDGHVIDGLTIRNPFQGSIQ